MLGGGLLLGATPALRRRGRYGVGVLGGHSDFPATRNSPVVGSAAGADLALVTGRGQPDLTSLEDRSPYVREG